MVCEALSVPCPGGSSSLAGVCVVGPPYLAASPHTLTPSNTEQNKVKLHYNMIELKVLICTKDTVLPT